MERMPELSPRRRVLVLAICCMSLLIVSLDVTVLNVALPAMQRDLHASTAGLQWTIDAYTLVLAALLMLAGSTADRVGRKKVFMAGLVVFAAGSLLCSLAPNLELLVAARMVQAVGGSMLNPVAMSIITNTFTDPRERARAIGAWGAVVGISMAAGPLLGGLLVESVGWRSIFWINLPVGLAALLATLRYVPESRAPKARRPDPVGQLLVIVLFGCLTYAIIEAPEAGAATSGPFAAVALAALLGLLWYEPRRAEPLIDLRFFRSAPFSGATVVAISAFAALGGFLFLSTLYLQNVRGLDALHAGLWMLPMAVPTFLCAPLSGRLVGTRGPRLPLVIAGTAMTLSGLLFALFDAETSDATLFLGYVLFGVGFGFVNAPITNTAVSGMPRSQAGVAAAVASTSRQLGQTLGVAVIGAVLAAGVSASSYRATFTEAAVPAGGSSPAAARSSSPSARSRPDGGPGARPSAPRSDWRPRTSARRQASPPDLHRTAGVSTRPQQDGRRQRPAPTGLQASVPELHEAQAAARALRAGAGSRSSRCAWSGGAGRQRAENGREAVRVVAGDVVADGDLTDPPARVVAQPFGQRHERAARPRATADERPPRRRAEVFSQPDRLEEARQWVRSRTRVEPFGDRDPSAVGAGAGDEQRPEAVAGQGPAGIPVVRDVGVDEDELVESVAEPVRDPGDHHPAVAVPAQRDRCAVATLDDLGHLVDMGVEVRRSVHVGRPVRLQPRQGHRLDVVTVSVQLGGDRVERPAALPTTRHHHVLHRVAPWAKTYSFSRRSRLSSSTGVYVTMRAPWSGLSQRSVWVRVRRPTCGLRNSLVLLRPTTTS